ncbi:tetratricopeptide repeat protein [Coralliovum pocilloporae]|uniref:tetratricopeptide repeat protein n=1 Tax=Coralliovum pocilloporae TaxID=3066369 RepID=UPI0033073C9A
MSDSNFIREVDEELRQDQLRSLWDRFGPFILLTAVLIVVGTTGYRGWQYWQASEAATNGDKFLAALELAENGDHLGAEAALLALASDSSGGYPLLARFRAASAKAEAGEKEAAIADFDAVASAASDSALLRDMASLRAAMLALDVVEDRKAVEARLLPLSEPGAAYVHSAREIQGLLAYKHDDFAAATTVFEGLVNDATTPQGIRVRSERMLSLIAGLSGKGGE